MYKEFIISLAILYLFTLYVDKIYPHVNWAAKTHFKYYVLINFLVFTNILILIIMVLKGVINFLMEK